MEGIVDVLLVDDDADSLSMMLQVLQNDGITVVCADSAEDALVKMESNAFRVMLTDWNMPGMNGITLAEMVAEREPLMPVYLMTGDILADIPRLAKDAGIRAVLNKPFSSTEMLRVIRDALSCNTPDCCGAC